MLECPQVAIQTTHHFHAGLYSRTIRIPAGVMITGALIKIPTLLAARLTRQDVIATEQA